MDDTQPAEKPIFVESWKRIAETMGRSLRSCRNYAARAHDPLPVFHVGGLVRLNLADLDAWIDRQRATFTATPPVDQLAALRAEVAALRGEILRLTEVVLRNLGTFSEAQIAAVLAVKGGDQLEASRG